MHDFGIIQIVINQLKFIQLPKLMTYTNVYHFKLMNERSLKYKY
jgi:hypothetical protein